MNQEIRAKIASQPLKAIDMLLDLAADRRSWAAEKVDPLVALLAVRSFLVGNSHLPSSSPGLL